MLDDEGLASAAPEYEYPKGTLLFNLTKDIGETTNVAADHREVVREMTEIYEQLEGTDDRVSAGSEEVEPS